MAAIINGSTFKGYFKITPDDASPHAWHMIPKAELLFASGAETSGTLTSAGNNISSTDASTEDEFGNVLDTSIKVAQYISDNR